MWIVSRQKVEPEINAEWKTEYAGTPTEIVLRFDSTTKLFLSFEEARQVVQRLSVVLAQVPGVDE